LYSADYFREEDRTRILEIMRENAFAVLVADDGTRPIASHLLVETDEDQEGIVINGHMSRANPLWQLFATGRDVLLIFQGPDTYISATWYNHVNVPTWNYQSVHAYGQARIIEGEEYYQVLSRLIARHEGENTYRLENLPQDFVQQSMRGTAGFQVRVTRLEAVFKLSQNRADGDYRRIVVELDRRGDEQSRQVAAAMRRNRRLDESLPEG
jgi:transcriptional regulator